MKMKKYFAWQDREISKPATQVLSVRIMSKYLSNKYY